jgi:hypothetical protein
MSVTPEEMRLRDVAIGKTAELIEANHQREKTERTNAQLLDVIAKRDAEIVAIRHSYTWKIGSLVLAPLHWIKRSKR